MKVIKMELVLIFLGGLIVGGGTVFGLTHQKKPSGNEDIAKGS